MKRLTTIALACGMLLTASACADKGYEAEDELSEAVFLNFVKSNSVGAGPDSRIIDDAVSMCERIEAGEDMYTKVKNSPTETKPYYIAILVGATTWYCPEFESEAAVR